MYMCIFVYIYIYMCIHIYAITCRNTMATQLPCIAIQFPSHCRSLQEQAHVLQQEQAHTHP